jgi:hypothetical protein
MAQHPGNAELQIRISKLPACTPGGAIKRCTLSPWSAISSGHASVSQLPPGLPLLAIIVFPIFSPVLAIRRHAEHRA